MRRRRDDLAGRRTRLLRVQETDGPPETTAAIERVTADASTPEELDNAATDRDSAAEARDVLAAARDQLDRAPDWVQQMAVDRMLASRDRAAAALDRQEAALDRHRAARYLADAYRDELTGVLQRNAGRDQLSHAMARAERAGESLIVGFLDVDHLKRINDEQGHPAGDRLLREVGQALLNGLRSYDLVMRYGGDEFVCALPQTALDEAAGRFAAISDALNESLEGASFSIGLVQLANDEGLDEALARADRAMYAARRAAATHLATAIQPSDSKA